jgi:1,4-dihydroxy-2-naphthoate octaprenyltransferase
LAEPSQELLGGEHPAQLAKRLILSTRPPFLTASALPVLFGSAYGAVHAVAFDAVSFTLALLTTVIVGAAANVLNDVFDDASGADPGNRGRLHPFTGGSRFIQNGVMTRAQMARWGAMLVGVAIALGLMLVLREGPAILLFGLAGLGLAVAYSMPPLSLSGRGLGELTVATAFGLLPVSGAAWLQTGTLDWSLLLLSLPVGAWVCNILLINEVPDAPADARAGKRTLVVRMSGRDTRWTYVGLHASAAAAALVAVGLGLLPWPAPLVPLAIALAAAPMSRGIESREVPALIGGIKFTLAAHAVGTLWLTGCVLAL